MFRNLKLDFPALLALLATGIFAAVLVLSSFTTYHPDPGTQKTLESLVVLCWGYYFGSSSGSKAKDEMIAGSFSSPPAATVPLRSRLTDAETSAIVSASISDSRLNSIITAINERRATPDDLAYLVAKGLLSQDRANTIQA